MAKVLTSHTVNKKYSGKETRKPLNEKCLLS